MKQAVYDGLQSHIYSSHALTFPKFIRHVILALAVLLLMSQSSQADPVSYIDANGNAQTCISYTSVTSDSTSWTSGWYVVDSDVTISERIKVSGDVHLILSDDATLTASLGINVSGDNSLTIYGQTEGTGTLKVSGAYDENAGIGGDDGQSGGNITINGGIVNATGGERGAGIGGGFWASGGTITINSGNVKVTGGFNAAGIGGGRLGAGGNITINGGTIKVTGGFNAAGIGGGSYGNGGNITITGGNITATGGDGGAGIGGGNNTSCGNITINGGIVRAVSSVGGSGIGCGIEGRGGTITLSWTNITDSLYASGYGGTEVTISDDKEFAREQDAKTCAVYSGTLTYDQMLAIARKTLRPLVSLTDGTSWNDCWYKLDNDLTISDRITVTGTAHLILNDGYTLTAPKGINVANRNSLVIYGDTNNTGTLIINDAGDENAGIGGSNEQSGGTITINGGTINITGGELGAGIGGGNKGYGGVITLNGGNITATGGDGGAGIGGGNKSAGGNIALGWTEESDSIYASSYNGTVTITKGFVLDGTETAALSSNVDGKKIIPSTKVHAVSADANITVNAWVYEGDTVTLSYSLPSGYEFTSYSVSGADLDGNTFIMPANDVTVTLNITPITYTISYTLNGGTADNPTSYTVETESFTLTNPTRNGYTFSGWTGTDLDAEATSVTIAKGSTGNRTYTANWMPITYIITYTLNGGIADNPDSYTVETESFTLNSPTRDGYSFTGWLISGDEIATLSTDLTISTGTLGNKEYIANWSIITYSITYNLDEGTADNPASYTVESEDFTLANPTKEGYTFTGWTGTNGDTPETSVTIAKGSTGDRTYTANWKEDAPPPSFKYNSLFLDGKIGVNFYVSIPDDLEDSKDCSMTFTIAGPGTMDTPEQQLDEEFTYTDDTGKYYGFTCYINSLQMADQITATLHYGDSKTVTKTTSAKDYIDRVLADTEQEDYSVIEELMAAIKDYGHYAQIMLANEHDNLSIGEGDDSYTEMDAEYDFNASDYAQVMNSTDKYAVVKTGMDNSGVNSVAHSLSLSSSTAINLYFDVDNADSAASWKAYIDGGQASFTHYKDSTYKVVIDDIPAHKLGKTYTVKIEGDDTLEVEISALSYVNATLAKYEEDYSKDTTGDCDAVTAIYRYYTATMAYRKAKGYKD